VSLRAGTLARFRSHLESSHDALHSSDLLVAATFLQGPEVAGLMATAAPRVRRALAQAAGAQAGREGGGLDRLLAEEEEKVVGEIAEEEVEEKVITDEEVEEVTYNSLETTEDHIEVEDIEVEIQKYEEQKEEKLMKNGKEAIKCSECRKTITKGCMRKHMRRCQKKSVGMTKGSESPALVKCDECDKTMNKCNLPRHKRRNHSISSGKQASLDTVDEKVKNVLDFVSTTSAEIIDMKSAIEEVDDKMETDEETHEVSIVETEEQENKSKNNIENTFACDECDKKFTQKKNMRRHKKTHHTE